MTKSSLMQGNEAIAWGAIYAGANYYAGYPITPSSEIAEVCSNAMPRHGGIFMQMEDEIASMAAIVGASAAGAKAFTATSGPGFTLMQEHIGAAIIMETPVVVVNVQRQGPSVGLATKPEQADIMQIRWGRHGDQAMVCLIPASVRECFEYTVQAFNIAEKYRTCVIVAPDEVIGHMRENFVQPAPGEIPVVNRAKPTCAPSEYKPHTFKEGEVAPLAAFGSEYVFRLTTSMHNEDAYSNSEPENATARTDQMYTKLEKHLDDITFTKFHGDEDYDTLIITAGSPVRASRTAALEARAEGKKVSVLQLITMWPFPADVVRKYGSKAKTVIVPELNRDGQIAGEVGKCLPDSIPIKRVNKYNGTVMTPEEITACIKGGK
ncbi:2-oxoacid:acceptor oxidoreductase subunit alpha [Desulfovibrio sp. OttesenSCG-928-O18]|nr:2-oxoacid:acceptor oxidoreductase subunit alpha [Desulfovibrio sp. OttesenSCG-928-O18]